MDSSFVRVLGRTPVIKLLDLLMEGRELDYTVQDIAEGADLSWITVKELLPELVKLGLAIKTHKIGRIQLYRFNSANLIAKKLLEFDMFITDVFVKRELERQKILA